MLDRFDLKDYRLRSELSLRDVARYCNVSAQLIGQIENGEKYITENNYWEIVKGINTARQKKKDGTFVDDKAEELQKTKEAEAEKKATAEVKKPTPKKGTAKG